jgi:hypothetical protein
MRAQDVGKEPTRRLRQPCRVTWFFQQRGADSGRAVDHPGGVSAMPHNILIDRALVIGGRYLDPEHAHAFLSPTRTIPSRRRIAASPNRYHHF